MTSTKYNLVLFAGCWKMKGFSRDVVDEDLAIGNLHSSACVVSSVGLLTQLLMIVNTDHHCV